MLGDIAKVQGPYSQLIIFFITYEWVQYVKVLQFNKLERLVRDKHFILWGPFVR
jgi:hypothetical protein